MSDQEDYQQWARDSLLKFRDKVSKEKREREASFTPKPPFSSGLTLQQLTVVTPPVSSDSHGRRREDDEPGREGPPPEFLEGPPSGEFDEITQSNLGVPQVINAEFQASSDWEETI